MALLDNHPELLVLPEETAYFPTVLTKYAPRGRRAQFDYLTTQSLANVLFGGTGRSIQLQPLSVEGSVGINLSLGVSGLTLTAAH